MENSTAKKSILLVQFNAYHEEILSPQIRYLHPEFNVLVGCTKESLKNGHLKKVSDFFTPILFKDDFETSLRGLNQLIKTFRTIKKYIIVGQAIKRYKVAGVVFNTITKKSHLVLIKFFLKKTPKAVILHNGHKWIDKKNSRKLNIFKRIIVLSEDVYDEMKSKIDNQDIGRLFFYFLPLRAKEMRREEGGLKISNHINLAVIGSINTKRRNYFGLFRALSEFEIDQKPNFTIFLLGKMTKQGRTMIQEYGVEKFLRYYDEFVPEEKIEELLLDMDLLVFLIDRTVENCHLYNRYKITGISTYANSTGIPCLVSDDYRLDKTLLGRTVSYSGSDIGSVLNKIQSGLIKKEDLKTIKNNPLPDFCTISFQKKRYVNMIEEMIDA